MARGTFITFEGGEGAGKSTQVRGLAKRLREMGHSVVETREPGGAPGAESIRSLLVTGDVDRWTGMSETLLHFAARAEHLEYTIRPALARGDWVVCDRFTDSTMAYQGYAHKVGRSAVEEIYRLVVGDDGPDVTIILDIDVETGLKRAGGRGGDENRYESMDRSFHDAIRQAFLDIAAREPDRCVVVDAAQALDAVTEAVWVGVSARLKVQ